jgi:amidophosphoribosyltransferase
MASHDDRPKDACGVVGAWQPGQHVAVLVRRGLLALQHRGEESAGIVVTDAGQSRRLVGAGLVGAALPAREVLALPGSLAVGHVRYSTAGARSVVGAQPIQRRVAETTLSLAHNGNLVNCTELAMAAGLPVEPDRTDSDLVATLLADAVRDLSAFGVHGPAAFEQALTLVLPRLVGAYSFVLSDGELLYGVRDPNGLRPLCLGRLSGGWVLASETPALDEMGAQFVREVDPGEVVVIGGSVARVRSIRPFPPEQVRTRLCLFELVYFARPDGHLRGTSVLQARYRAGEALAEHAPPPVDRHRPALPTVVISVPSSADAAARGYADRAGLPYRRGLSRNRAVGRSFLAPLQSERQQKVGLKFAPVPEVVSGHRVVVVDDSLVRGTTTRTVIEMLRIAGAAEVHLRIASPPWRWPCYLGIDAGHPQDLAAAVCTLSELRAQIGSDTLAYLPLPDLLRSTGVEPEEFCTGCITGRYPVPIPAPTRVSTTHLFASCEPLIEGVSA